MTINKNQGQIMKSIGLDLLEDPSMDIYVALARVGNADNIHIFAENQKTRNANDTSVRNYMNDSLRTTAFITYEPEVIACACIYLAARHLQIPLGTNWFDIFGYTEDIIQEICLVILRLYSLEKPDLNKLEAEVAELRRSQIEARNKKIAELREENQAKKEEIERKKRENMKKEKRDRSSSRHHKSKKRKSRSRSTSKNRSRSRRREREYSRDRRSKVRDDKKHKKIEDETKYRRSDNMNKQKRQSRRSFSRDSSSSERKISRKESPFEKNSHKYVQKLSKRYNGVTHKI